MRSRVFALALAGLALSAGCRDLVTPEAALNGGHPDLQLMVVGLGVEGGLVDARVRIDNTAYVDPVFAVAAETVTVHQGIATFEDLPAGLYDIDIHTRGYVHATPPWSERGVALGESLAVVSYEGIESAIAVDWPLLDELTAGSYATIVRVSYRQTEPGNPWIGEQRFYRGDDGIHRGTPPWEGMFSVYVEARGPGLSLDWSAPDSIPLTEGGEFALPSPLHRQPLDLRFGSDPVTADRVMIRQYESGSFDWKGWGAVDYPLDRTTSPDSLILLEIPSSKLEVSWVDGPAFLSHRVWLGEGSVVLGPIDLGPHRLELSVSGPDGEALAATVFLEVETRANSFTADGSGHLRARLHPGRYRLTLEHSGHETRSMFVDVDGDLDLDLQLERSPG